MSSRRSVIVSGVIALLIAVALLAGAFGSGVLTTTLGNQGSGSTGTTQTQSGKSGTLAVLMTDPPTVPTGVSAVYVTYSSLAVHSTGAGQGSGWIVLNTQGQIDLMSIINVTQTIATANISSGTFNELAFNITSATVTYQEKNYSALLVYQDHTLIVPISGEISVSQGQTSAAVIDLTPTVLLLGTPSNPNFAFIPAAHAYAVPPQSTASLHLRVGGRDDVHTAPWYLQIRENTHFNITAASLSANSTTGVDSLSITVQNTGNTSLLFRMAVVTSTTSLYGGYRPNTFPGITSISEFFVVQPNGTLVAFTGSDRAQLAATMVAGGYLLSPHASATFTYTGKMVIGALQMMNNPMMNPQPTQQVQSGQRYVISIQANGMMAQTLLAAQ